MTIEFFLLACSFKYGGRCVAGIDLTNNKLIRLISRDSTTNYAIDYNYCFVNGEPINVGIIYLVELTEKAPIMGAQTENYYVDYPFIKQKIGIGQIDLDAFSYNRIYPFGNKLSFISVDRYNALDISLCIKKAYSLHFVQTINKDGKVKTKLDFCVIGRDGSLIELKDYSVTDPDYCIFDGSTYSNYIINEAYVLFSLPPKSDDLCETTFNVFVAGILVLIDD